MICLSINCKPKEFDLITTTLDKVFSNLKINYGVSKFYRIRSDSKTFNTYLNNEYCLKILEIFGFFKEANSTDLIYDINTDENQIIRSYTAFEKALKAVVSKIL